MLYNLSNTAVLHKNGLNVVDVAEVLENLQEGMKNLLISSSGGEFYTALMGFHHIMPRKVTIIGGEFVGSAALSIFLCGNRRLSFPDSRFTFHEVQMPYEGRIIRELEIELKLEIAILTKQYDVAENFATQLQGCRMANRITAMLLCQRTGMSLGTAHELMSGDGTTLTAQEARSYGFVHEIIPRSRFEM